MLRKRYLFSISVLISLLIILIPISLATELNTYDNLVLRTSEQRINLYAEPNEINQLSDPGKACVEQKEENSGFTEDLGGIISILEKIFTVLFTITTVMSAIDTIISTTAMVIGMFDGVGGCCTPPMLICPGPCGTPCTAMSGFYEGWSNIYSFVKPLSCFVNCGWCSGAEVGGDTCWGIDFLGDFNVGELVPDLKSSQGFQGAGGEGGGIGFDGGIGGGAGIGQFHLSPFDNIYLATACLCPVAIIFNLRKLKAINEVYDCCVQEACENGLSTEPCEKQLDEATCMFWEGSFYSMLANILMSLLTGLIVKLLFERLIKDTWLEGFILCAYAVFKLIQIPSVIGGVMSAWGYMGKTFDEPDCEALGFDDVKKDIQQQWADLTLVDQNRDGVYDSWAKTSGLGGPQGPSSGHPGGLPVVEEGETETEPTSTFTTAYIDDTTYTINAQAGRMISSDGFTWTWNPSASDGRGAWYKDVDADETREAILPSDHPTQTALNLYSGLRVQPTLTDYDDMEVGGIVQASDGNYYEIKEIEMIRDENGRDITMEIYTTYHPDSGPTVITDISALPETTYIPPEDKINAAVPYLSIRGEVQLAQTSTTTTVGGIQYGIGQRVISGGGVMGTLKEVRLDGTVKVEWDNEGVFEGNPNDLPDLIIAAPSEGVEMAGYTMKNGKWQYQDDGTWRDAPSQGYMNGIWREFTTPLQTYHINQRVISGGGVRGTVKEIRPDGTITVQWDNGGEFNGNPYNLPDPIIAVPTQGAPTVSSITFGSNIYQLTLNAQGGYDIGTTGITVRRNPNTQELEYKSGYNTEWRRVANSDLNNELELQIQQAFGVSSSATTGVTAPPNQAPTIVIPPELTKDSSGNYYTREGYIGVYYIQADGSIYYTGGWAPDGRTLPPQTLTKDKLQRLVDDSEWDTKLNEPFNVKALELQKNAEGNYYTRNGYEGEYYLQADGSIFYTGGKGPNGAYKPPQTLPANADGRKQEGVWDLTRNKPLRLKVNYPDAIVKSTMYDMAWTLLDATLGEGISKWVENKCKEDSETSYPASDTPTSGGASGGYGGIGGGNLGIGCTNTYNAQFISKDQIGATCHYFASYGISSCDSSIDYTISLVSNPNRNTTSLTVRTGHLIERSSISQQITTTSNVCEYNSICITTNASEQCFPP